MIGASLRPTSLGDLRITSLQAGSSRGAPPIVQPPLTLNSGGGFEAETKALVARFTTPATRQRKVWINRLIKALKTAGVWQKLDALYVAAAADSQAATRNWKQDLYNATAIASPAFVADRGFTGNGTSSYLQTGFTASSAVSPKYLQDSAAVGAWMLTDVAAEGAFDIAAFRSGGDTRLNSRNSGNQPIAFMNGPGVGGSVVPTSVGLTVASRVSAAGARFFKNGVFLNAPAAVSVQVPNSQFGLLGFGTGGGYSTRQGAAWFIGGGLTDAEVLATYNALNQYLVAVGAV